MDNEPVLVEKKGEKMIPLDLEYFINHCVPTVLTEVLALVS